MSNKVPVVVTLSGRVEVDVTDEMTAVEIRQHVMAHWNLDETQIYQPFVVVSDSVRNSMSVCGEDDQLRDHMKEHPVLRVVLPLASKE